VTITGAPSAGSYDRATEAATVFADGEGRRDRRRRAFSSRSPDRSSWSTLPPWSAPAIAAR